MALQRGPDGQRLCGKNLSPNGNGCVGRDNIINVVNETGPKHEHLKTAEGGSTVSARINAAIRICIGIAGLLTGFYRLSQHEIGSAMDVVLLASVCIAGLLSFAGRFLFHQGDSCRLQLEPGDLFYQYEAGFAHLAFAVIALFAYFGPWDVAAKILTILGYTLFILQTALLYAWRCHVRHHIISRYFLRHSLIPLVYAGLMLYFAAECMTEAGISLF